MTARLLAPLATVLFAVAVLVVGPERPQQPLLRATAGGDMQLESSRDGQAILSTASLRPGHTAEGTLTLGNRAPSPQHLTLTMDGLADMPGPGGGVLSRRLDLVVERDGGDVVYAGKLADLPELDLGGLAPGASSPFRFVVALPEDGPAVDDAYAGASVAVTWSWRGDVEGSESGPPSPVAPAGADDPPPSPSSEPDPVPAAPEDAPAPRIDFDRSEGPAAGIGSVRLWLGGRSVQRAPRSIEVLARCRPACSAQGTAVLRQGGRRIARLRLRSALSGQLGRLRFALSRRIRAALRSGSVTVSVRIVARAPGQRPVAKIRTLRLRP